MTRRARLCSAQRAVLRHGRYDRSCKVGTLELLRNVSSNPNTSSTVRTPELHDALPRLAPLLALHLLIRCELQPVAVHTEQCERRPAIKSVLSLVVGYRAGPASTAHNRQ